VLCDNGVALLIWDNIVKYVSAVKSKKLPDPKNKSFEVVKSCVKDPLFKAKLQFFRFIAIELRPFLEEYQTDKHMVCFIFDDLVTMIRSLMKKFIKDAILAVSDEQIIKIDVKDKENHKNYTDIDMGFSYTKCISEAKPSDRQKLQIRNEGKDFLIALLKKLLTKCPCSYSLVRYLSCLNPVKMQSDKNKCVENFKKMLHLLFNNSQQDCDGLINSQQDCDGLINLYSFFLEEIPRYGSDRFKDFNTNMSSVDELFHECMSQNSKYQALLELIQLLLTMSHGQAPVERGFSINKKVEVENLKHESIIAHRLICDHVNKVGGIQNVDLSKELLQSCKASRHKYEIYLQQKREAEKLKPN
jgi:hypothetical protein